jgi:O-antigen/teichoic acid export membrane protein
MPPAPSTRVARNTLLSLAGQGIPAVVGVIAMPFIVRGLGQERLGLLGLGWVVLGYFSLMDLGMGRAAARFIADAIGRGDPDAVPSFAWSAVMMQAVVGGIGAVIVASTAAPIASLLHVKADLLAEAIRTFRILAFAIPVTLISASFRGILEAARRFDLVAIVAIPGSTLNFLIPLVATLTGISFATMIALLVAGRVATLLAYAGLGIRVFPALASPRASRSALRALLPFGAWLSVSSLISPILDQLDRFFLGAFAGVASVGYYTAPQEMVLRLRAFPTALATALFPEFSSLAAPGGAERGRRYYALSIRFLTLFLAPVVFALVWLGPDLLNLWLGKDFAEKSGMALGFLAVGLMANSIAYVPYAFLHGTNRPDIPAKFHLLELPCFVILAYLLMPRYGVAGAGAVWALRAWLDAGLLLTGARRRGASIQGATPGITIRAWIALLAVAVLAGFMPMARELASSVRVGLVLAGGLIIGLTGWMALLAAEDRSRIRAAVLSFSAQRK